MPIKKSPALFILPLLLVGCSRPTLQNHRVTNTVDNITTNRVNNSVSTTPRPTLPNRPIPANLLTSYSQEMQHVLNDLSTRTKTPLYAPIGNVGFIEKYHGSVWTYEIELTSGVWIFGTTYQTNAAAINAMTGEFPLNKAIADGPIEQGSSLHQYRTGATYPNGIAQEVIDWTDGKWEIDVFGAPSLDLLNTAKTLDGYLMTHALPPFEGYLFVDQGTAANSKPLTQIGFVDGNTYYLVEGQNMNDALAIATSLRAVSAPNQR